MGLDRQEIHRVAGIYLVEKVGNTTFPATPRFSQETQTWKVAIQCKTDKGTLVIGEMTLDSKGNILSIPSREMLAATAERVYAQTPVLVYASPEALKKAGFEVVKG